MQAAKRGAVGWDGSRLLHNLNASKSEKKQTMKLFPHYHHTAGVFSLSEHPKQHNSRTQNRFSVERILLHISVSWQLNCLYKRWCKGWKRETRQITDMKASTVIVSNKKHFGDVHYILAERIILKGSWEALWQMSPVGSWGMLDQRKPEQLLPVDQSIGWPMFATSDRPCLEQQQ